MTQRVVGHVEIELGNIRPNLRTREYVDGVLLSAEQRRIRLATQVLNHELLDLRKRMLTEIVAEIVVDAEREQA